MTAPTVKPNTNGNGQKPKTVATVPFTRASREKSKQAFVVASVALDAATGTTNNPIQVPAGGFLKYIDIRVVGVTAANAANVTFDADGPYNVISYLDVRNSAGDSLIVPLTGFQLYLINKYGAVGSQPPYADPRYSTTATTGAGATGGSFEFILRIPLEADPRDAFCAAPNLASNKSYFVQINYNASNNVYGTAPTTPPTVTTTGVMYYWSQPNQMNSGEVTQQVAPMGNGSASLWRLDLPAINTGDQLVDLHNVGNIIKTVIFTLRDANGDRTSTDWPDTAQIVLNDDILHYLPVDFWTDNMRKAYGYVGTIDTAGGLDTGVFVIHEWNDQDGMVFVDGPRDQWLVTSKTTSLQIRATSFGANASRFEVLSNEFKPTSPAALYSPNIV